VVNNSTAVQSGSGKSKHLPHGAVRAWELWYGCGEHYWAWVLYTCKFFCE